MLARSDAGRATGVLASTWKGVTGTIVRRNAALLRPPATTPPLYALRILHSIAFYVLHILHYIVSREQLFIFLIWRRFAYLN